MTCRAAERKSSQGSFNDTSETGKTLKATPGILVILPLIRAAHRGYFHNLPTAQQNFHFLRGHKPLPLRSLPWCTAADQEGRRPPQQAQCQEGTSPRSCTQNKINVWNPIRNPIDRKHLFLKTLCNFKPPRLVKS